MHSSDEQDMENEIAADVSDSQATAAAQKAVEENEEDKAPTDHSAQQIATKAPSAQDVKAAEQASAKDVKIDKVAEVEKKAEETLVKATPPSKKQEAQVLSVSSGK